MTRWWRACEHDGIHPVEVVESTRSHVTVRMDSRHSLRPRISGAEGYFERWEDARAWLLSRADNALIAARSQFLRAHDHREEVAALTKPEDA